MADLLFITPQYMTSSTILSGNIDIDKYNFCILNTQLTVIEPLLGTELYDKIKTDIEGNVLTGIYLTLYNDFIKPITKHSSVSLYVEIGSYIVDNGGIYKRTGDNVEVVNEAEVSRLANKSNILSQVFVKRFYKFIKENYFPEYKTCQSEVDASNSINLISGWKL